MLFAYLSVLFLVPLICFNAQFGFGWEALLKSPARDRVEAIGEAISLRMSSCQPNNWNDILNNFGKKYGVDLYVFDIFGHQLAGKQINLPTSIESHLQMQLGSLRGPFPKIFNHPDNSQFDQISVLFDKSPFFCPPPQFDFNESRMLDRLGGGLIRHHAASIFHGSNLPGGINMSKPALFDFFLPPPLSPPPPPNYESDKFISKLGQVLWIGMPIRLSIKGLGFPIPAFLIASSSNIWHSTLLLDFKFMAVVFFGFLVFSVIFWWPFVFNITRKLSTLTIAAENIAEGNFTIAVDNRVNDEIGRLSAAIKSMSDRLNGFVQGQKRFLGDISHELITPLARLDMALALFESSNNEERLTIVTEAQEEVREMTLMVDELLAFAKAGLQNKESELQPVGVRAIIEKALRQLPDATEFEIDVPNDVRVLAEPTLLLRAISNILRNSVRYAHGYGPIKVQVNEELTNVSIVIADNGPGVPPEILSHLGEPFFRPEFSRNRDSGGIGLGLAIVKSCVECCHGNVTLSNRKGGGFQTEIQLRRASEFNFIHKDVTTSDKSAKDKASV